MEQANHHHQKEENNFYHSTSQSKSRAMIFIMSVAAILALLAIFLLHNYKPVGKGNIWEEKQKAEMAATAKSSEDEDENENKGGAAKAEMAVATVGSLDSTTGNFMYNVGNITKLKLGDSTTIEVGENSTEAKLYRFLSDEKTMVDTADKTKGWISCDRLVFETGKSTLTKESQNQLQNLAAILKYFPAATVKMGGYTDNVGSAEINKKISQQRADAASAGLQKIGIAAARIKAEGYGPEHPIADNATKAGQAQNRRIDIRVTKK